MEDGAFVHVVPDGGVSLLQQFLRKGRETFPVARVCKALELSEREVARMDGDDVEKAGLDLRVAEFLDPFDVV
jgi:hypothetical protein